MDQRIINLYDEYTHKPLSRQQFISRLVKLTGSMAVAMSVLPALEGNYANADITGQNDPSLLTETISYPGGGEEMKGYFARPKAKGKYGAVVVIHENRGLNPHTMDVARRVAKAGYLALAVDALAPMGGTPQNEDEARDMIGKLDMNKTLNNYLKAFDYLNKLPDSNKKTGCVGFCWGGAMPNQLAVHSPDLDAAVAYYGRQPEAADVPKIKASVMLHYAGLDERINAGIPAYEAALKAAGTDYELFIYDGVNHAFNNDTSAARYDAKAAKLAWDRTLELFAKKVKS